MAMNDESQQEALVAYDLFRAAMKDRFAPYCTESVAEGNLSVMLQWGVSNLPNGLISMREIGAWQICFEQCLAQLDRDPAWKSAAEKKSDFIKLYDSLSAAEVKERTAKDPTFKTNLALLNQ